MDLNQFQGDAIKLNPSVLRGAEGSTLHFITIPRNTDNEYIDHALLSPECIAAHIQNGLVVDIIQSQHDQQGAMPSHNIYNDDAIEQNSSRLEMASERHYISNENVSMPIENITQSLHSSHSIPAEHLSHRPHFESKYDNIEADRKVIINDAGRQYIVTNEAPVIVSSKEVAAMSMNDLNLTHSFPNAYNQIDQTVLQDSSISDQHLESKIQANSLPSLPPLTPISKLHSMRKSSIEHQQPIQYKSIAHSSTALSLPKSNSILKNMCFVADEDELNFVQSNMKLIRQTSKEQTIPPKKNLPHKKRLTKKLKSISPNLDLMLSTEHHSHEMSYLQGHTQNESLNLTLNQHPLQLTTSRINQTQSTNEYISPEHYSNSTDATGMNSVHMQQIPIEPPARFTCELCGMQTETQLSFYNHLKLHYEPELSTQTCKMSSIRSTLLALDQSSQHIYLNERKIDVNQCSQSMNSPVIMSDNFARMQNDEQDLRCISGMENEDVTDDESINYHDTGLSGIKSEQNEFSDTEDMLENGVLDKVRRVVDSYIENGVKNLIDMNDSQHPSLDTACNWTANNSHGLSSNAVYTIEKTEPVIMNESNFVITMNNQSKEPSQSTQNHIVNSQPIDRPEELTLIYDFSNMDDTSNESILRRQLIRETPSNDNDPSDYEKIEAPDSKVDISMDAEISTYISESARGPASKLNIQDEFIEEEQTDSDVDPDKPDAQKKKKKIFRCKRCNKLCNSKNALHYHFLSHTGERPHQCNECGKSFFASSALKVHKRLHSGDKPYSCDFCNRPFRQWGDLKYHIQSKHTKEKSHQCEFCGKDFARRYSLVIHRRIHTGEKNYKCEFCDKEFRASSYLQVHRKIHTGEKPFVCDVCGKRFRVRGDLKRHSNIHERNKTKQAKVDDMNCMSNGSTSGKNEMFIMEDNNTAQSRSTDTLDQLVSVIESTDAQANDDEKKRNFIQIGYDKSFTKTKYKRDFKMENLSEDCSSSILDYSTYHLMDRA